MTPESAQQLAIYQSLQSGAMPGAPLGQGLRATIPGALQTTQGVDGRWYNVLEGTSTPVPPRFPFEKRVYGSQEEATQALRARQQYGQQGRGGGG